MNEKRETNFVKGTSSLGTPKSTAETSGNSAKTAQSLCRKEECTIDEGTFAPTAKKEPHKTGDKKICREYTSHNTE